MDPPKNNNSLDSFMIPMKQDQYEEDSDSCETLETMEDIEKLMEILLSKQDSTMDLMSEGNIKNNNNIEENGNKLEKKSINKDKDINPINNTNNTNNVKENIIIDSVKDNNKTSIKKDENNKERLQKALMEFINTEKSYVKCLITFVTGYKMKLEDPSVNIKNDIPILFGNASQILEHHKTIVKYIMEETKNIGTINCGVILNIVPFLLNTESEYKEYIVSQGKALPKLYALLKNKRFLLFFEKYCGGKESVGSGKDVLVNEFDSLSITPIQRFPRYILLFDAILSSLSKEDPFYPKIQEAKKKMHQFCKNINSHKAQGEMQSLISKSSGNISLFRESVVPFNSPQPQRILPVKKTPSPKTVTKNYNTFQSQINKVEPKQEQKVEQIAENPHQWRDYKLVSPEFCISCKNAILAKTSLRCKNCKLHCHENCESPKNCAGDVKVTSLRTSQFQRVYIRHEKSLSHAFLTTIKKETTVSLYLFDDLLCVTKPATNTFNVLHVIKYHSTASGQSVSIQKLSTNSLVLKNPRKISENHVLTFAHSYLRDSWHDEIQKAIDSFFKRNQQLSIQN